MSVVVRGSIACTVKGAVCAPPVVGKNSYIGEKRGQALSSNASSLLELRNTKKRHYSELIPQLLDLSCVVSVRSPRLVAVLLQRGGLVKILGFFGLSKSLSSFPSPPFLLRMLPPLQISADLPTSFLC